MNDICVICGADIPEGIQVCPTCVKSSLGIERKVQRKQMLDGIAQVADMVADRRDITATIFIGPHGTTISIYPYPEETEDAEENAGIALL